ncbi:MAG: hypothetical protein EOM12_03525 [Verrucomicrobiae bacterium]|nr:hypothetical protein [Verrucomicrobiae bacterium]
MKVIATNEQAYRGNRKYICEISHTEIEKFLNLYYDSLEMLKVGDHVDMSKGFKLYEDTKAAMAQTKAFIESNAKVIQTIMRGICLDENKEVRKESDEGNNNG